MSCPKIAPDVTQAHLVLLPSVRLTLANALLAQRWSRDQPNVPSTV